MNLSYRWLARHIDLSGREPEAIARTLTLHVAEIEAWHRFAPALDAVRVGRVLERQPHPAADRLSVCKVDVGQDAPLSIVCGAPNVAAGQCVAVAPVGAILPGGFEIQSTKIRGQLSQGMICSEKELGLGEAHEGIWVLPEGLAPGAVVSEAMGGPDWIFELENKAVTHRPDLWGHRGIAAELAAIWRQDLLPIDTEMPVTGDGPAFPLSIETEGCPRYIALPIDGVQGGRSPEWLRLLLLAAGQRPIDLLVDISNFVMLDLGQPNHLFDRERVAGGITVREARAGERMQTLDAEERELAPGDLLICSGDQPVALAGIMGGEGSKVAADTRSLLLEIANFDAAAVRRTSTRLNLRTDASARFEKALDPLLPVQAAAHLVHLLASIQPSLRLPSPMTDRGNWIDPSTSISLRPERLRRLLGVSIGDDEIRGMLGRLGFGVDASQQPWSVRIPSWRATKDVAIEEDLVEEVGRLHGYENIAEATLKGSLRPVPLDRRRALVRSAQDFLAGSPRFHEALTYSFIGQKVVEAIGAESEPYTEVVNAIAAGQDRLRRSVLPSLLGQVEHNLRHVTEVRVFEIGKGSRIEHRDDWGKPAEVHEIGLLWSGPAPAPDAGFGAARLQRLKGVIESLLAALEAPPPIWTKAAAEQRPTWAHPGRSAVARAAGASPASPPMVILAELDPLVARNLGLDPEIESAAAVVSIDVIVDAAWSPRPFTPLPRYPAVKIDVALAVAQDLPSADLEAAIRRAGEGLVAEIELFDVFHGRQLGEDRKSMAYHVQLQSEDGTLSDADGQRFLERLEAESAALGAVLRKA